LKLGDNAEAGAELALDGLADAFGHFGCRRRRGGLRQQTAGNHREQRA
jgi:hypothetical protein